MGRIYESSAELVSVSPPIQMPRTTHRVEFNERDLLTQTENVPDRLRLWWEQVGKRTVWRSETYHVMRGYLDVQYQTDDAQVAAVLTALAQGGIEGAEKALDLIGWEPA